MGVKALTTGGRKAESKLQVPQEPAYVWMTASVKAPTLSQTKQNIKWLSRHPSAIMPCETPGNQALSWTSTQWKRAHTNSTWQRELPWIATSSSRGTVWGRRLALLQSLLKSTRETLTFRFLQKNLLVEDRGALTSETVTLWDSKSSKAWASFKKQESTQKMFTRSLGIHLTAHGLSASRWMWWSKGAIKLNSQRRMPSCFVSVVMNRNFSKKCKKPCF